jgi:glutamate-1-semialdehyde 2,1-aminomutase
MPGTQSNLRAGANAPPPLVLTSGLGARVRDADGREYIDYTLGMGPAIFGYSNPIYLDAIQGQLHQLFSVTSARAHTTAEIELAEAISALLPCAENVRFAISGTEADQLAIRIARAYSGRRRFVRFVGHYHGWMDNVSVNSSEGQWQPSADESFCIAWNDAEALEALLREHSSDIALVLMEAVMCNFACCPPRPGYLQTVRQLCDRYGVLLCFDEVITGFRIGLSGAQGAFGVTPDLAVLGKALAGGLPLAAVAGRREILDVLRLQRVTGAGTFNAFPLAMAAGLATLRLLQSTEFAHYQRIDHLQARLMRELGVLLRRHRTPCLLQGPRGIFSLRIIDRDIAYSPQDLLTEDLGTAARLSVLLQEEGVLMAGGARFNLCSAMTDADVDETIMRFERALERLPRCD